jgi:nuclear pore complex protein Nup107
VEVYAKFLGYLAPASPEVKGRCLADARPWIPMEGAGGMRAIVSRALDDSRAVQAPGGEAAHSSIGRGPGHRERVLEWACLAGRGLHSSTSQLNLSRS